jgi:hypothetical protein
MSDDNNCEAVVENKKENKKIHSADQKIAITLLRNGKVLRDQSYFTSASKAVDVHKAGFEMFPALPNRFVFGVMGPSGCGKSFFIRNAILIHRQLHPQKPVFVFTAKTDIDSLHKTTSPPGFKYGITGYGCTETGPVNGRGRITVLSQDELDYSSMVDACENGALVVLDDPLSGDEDNKVAVQTLANNIATKGRSSGISLILSTHLEAHSVLTSILKREATGWAIFNNGAPVFQNILGSQLFPNGKDLILGPTTSPYRFIQSAGPAATFITTLGSTPLGMNSVVSIKEVDSDSDTDEEMAAPPRYSDDDDTADEDVAAPTAGGSRMDASSSEDVTRKNDAILKNVLQALGKHEKNSGYYLPATKFMRDQVLQALPAALQQAGYMDNAYGERYAGGDETVKEKKVKATKPPPKLQNAKFFATSRKKSLKTIAKATKKSDKRGNKAPADLSLL